MPNNVSNYKCPGCTGPLHFDSGTGKLECEYCGNSYTVEEIEKLYAPAEETKPEAGDAGVDENPSGEEPREGEEGEMHWNLDSAGSQWGDESGDVKVYNCPNCGAELICDATTAATSCPYCDNPTIIPSSLSGSLKPDLVIPFKLDKEAAKEAFRKHLKGKKLLPKLFRSENHIDEIKGIYVPFWLFDADAEANLGFTGTKTRSWSDSDYDYTETRYYDLQRSGSVGFDNIPVDGSEKMDDKLMESLEPFNAKEAVDFKTAYLAGYLADRYDVAADKCTERINQRVRQSTIEAFRSTTAGYSTVTPRYSNVNVENGRARYALYPVWIMNTTWKDQKFTFAMNGQTGKFVGNLPVDKSLAAKWRIIYSLCSFAVLYGLCWLFALIF
ncbi:MAG: hypothetical protein ACOX68_01845 [Candidatus Limivicinus sp.]|jgi:DNA-directed RNA polymerase subunit RPC12/RpoP